MTRLGSAARRSALAALLALVPTASASVQPAAARSSASGIVVSGIVLGPAGAGVDATRVELLPIPSNHEAGMLLLAGRIDPPPAGVAETGAEGRFALPAPSPGLFRLAVRAAGFVPMHLQPLALVEAIELAPVALRRDHGLVVRVLDAEGAPVEGALVVAATDGGAAGRVSLKGGWRPSLRRGLTDADGRLRLPRADGERLAVTVSARHAAASTVDGVASSSVVVRLAVAQPRSLEVRSAADRPLEGVLVRAGTPALPVGVSGADGRVALAVPGERSLLLRLSTTDGRRAVEEVVWRDGGAGSVLPPAAVLEGRVVDAAHGGPVAGALVWTGADPGTFARTDAAGRYRLMAPPASRFWVQAEAAGLLPAFDGVTATHVRGGRLPTLALASPAAIAGRVLDADGAAVGGAMVEAHPSRAGRRGFYRPDPVEGRAITDRRGRFRLARLAAGARYRLEAVSEGSAARAITVAAASVGGDAAYVELVLGAVRGLHGRVVDERERPIAGVAVAVRDARLSATSAAHASSSASFTEPDDPALGARSDPQGRFAIAEVPAPAVDIALAASGFAPMLLRGVEMPAGAGSFDLGTLMLVAGARLSGRVIDPEGVAVADAAVRLVEGSKAPVGLAALRVLRRDPDASSDADGRFAVDDLLPGKPVSLSVDADGFASAWVPAVRAPAAQPLEVVLRPATTIAGRVTDAAGGPVAGAEVGVTWQAYAAESRHRAPIGEPRSLLELTDRAGRFTIGGLEAGEATVEVHARGFVPPPARDLELAAGEAVAGVDFQLARGAVVEGRVATTDGTPLAGARVTAGVPAARTDAEGRYRIDGVALGDAVLEALHLDYGRRTREVEIAAGSNLVDWSFEPGQAVAGRVRDIAGTAIAGAEVELAAEDGEGWLAYRASSGADGAFTLSPVAAGRYRLVASKPGWAEAAAPGPVVVEDRALADLEVVLVPGAAIVGRIRGLDFDQLARTRVVAGDASGREWPGRVDHGGGYRIDDLAAGDWQVRAWLDVGARQADARVVLPAGEREVRRDLDFGGLTLTGSVLAAGEPLPDTAIALSAEGRARRRSVRTDHEGSFRFEDLVAGAYRMEISNLHLRAVDNRTVDLVADRHLVLELGGARLSGTVVSAASQQPVADAVVALDRLVEGDRLGTGRMTGGTDGEGAFELLQVPAGRYRLSARKDGFAPSAEDVQVDAGRDLGGLRLALEPTSGLDLEVRLASGATPSHVDAVVLDPAGRVLIGESRPVDSEGRARLPTVPAGTWEVVVGAPGAVAVRTSVEVPGAPLSLELAAAGRLQLRSATLAASDLIATLRLVGADGGALETLDAAGDLRAAWPIAGGRATIDRLPAGAWIVDVAAPDGRSWSVPVTVVSGRDTRLELD